MDMFPLTALLAHAELKTRAKQPATESVDARRATRITRYGDLTLFPRVERGELVGSTPAHHGSAGAAWEEPRVVATISNVSTTGVGLILNDELPMGLQFDVDWAEGDRPGPVRFEVVHTKPLSAGMYRTGARLVAGQLPAEPVPTPFVRRFAESTEADRAPHQSSAMVPAAEHAEPAAPAQPRGPRPMSLVRDGVMALSLVPAEPAEPDHRPTPAGTFRMSAAAGFEKTERLDGVTVCGWERSIEMRRDGDRMWLYVHSPGKKNGWGLFVDAEQFESAVARVQNSAGSPFVATTLAA
jgi:hypothetical protein